MTDTLKSPVFEEVFQNLRKVTEANLKMQQELFSQWTSMWPGLPTPQSAWMDKMRQFRTKYVNTISEMAKEHKKVVDAQYTSALESLDAALNVTEATSPEELRRKTEQLCRKSLDCMREMSESQIRELQESVTKLTDLLAKAGN
jgi:DNA anti-recombination protein RmuC